MPPSQLPPPSSPHLHDHQGRHNAGVSGPETINEEEERCCHHYTIDAFDHHRLLQRASVHTGGCKAYPHQ